MLITHLSNSARARLIGTGLACTAAMVAVVPLLAGGPAASAQVTPLSAVRLVVGHSMTDGAGHRWLSDRADATGGRVSTTSRHIYGTHQAQLFRSEREGRFRYRIPLLPGQYRVQLNVAEHTYRVPGQRVFAVVADGVIRARHIDPVAKVGALHADRVRFTVTVTGSVLRLRFVGHRHGAAVSSLSVIGLRHAAGAPTTPVPPNSDAPSPADPPSPSSPDPASYVTPENFGAVGDGVTDDTAALQATFDDADGRTVVLPAGHVYAHSAVLQLRTPSLHVTGPGELLATEESQSSVWIEADDVLIDGGVVIKTATTTQRWSAWEQMGVRLDGHQGITLRNVTVDGSAAAGVYVGDSTGFTLDHVTVENTRADGIHMTDGSSDGQVISPLVRNSGDDGVAVVSYGADGAPCHDITVTSPRVLGTTWGRGVSVVGGVNITETDIDVEQTSAAGVYVGAEGDPYNTAAPSNVVIDGGEIIGANTDTSVDHGAVLILSGENNVVPSDVTVENLTVSNTRSTASRDLGVITYGATPNDILLSGITIVGGPASAYQGNTDQSAFALRDIVQNGVRLPDQG